MQKFDQFNYINVLEFFYITNFCPMLMALHALTAWVFKF